MQEGEYHVIPRVSSLMELMGSDINLAIAQESSTLCHCLRWAVAGRIDRSQYYRPIVGKTEKSYVGKDQGSQGKGQLPILRHCLKRAVAS